MATIREKRPGVWEVRVFTGSDARGRPTQLSRTVRGGKRDAQRPAAEFEASGGKAKPAGRSVSDVLDVSTPTSSPPPTNQWQPASVEILKG